MDAPRVSLMVRSMDRPTLDRTLASAAAQDWPSLEIVVVAACGPRHRLLPTVFGGRPLRLVGGDAPYLTRPNAANVALDSAHGEWLLFLDDDDELQPAHISGLMSAKRPRGERVAYCAARVLDARDNVVGHVGAPGGHVQFLRGNRMQLGCALFQRGLVEEGARFDPAFDVYEDYDFLVNLATRTPFAYVPVDTAAWRASVGDSGCGMGENFRAELQRDYGARVRRKWAEPMHSWRNDFVQRLTQGQEALKQGDAETARRVLERAVADDPVDVNALNLCAMANHRSGHAARAQLLIRTACKAAPGHPQVEANRALIEGAA